MICQDQERTCCVHNLNTTYADRSELLLSNVLNFLGSSLELIAMVALSWFLYFFNP
jgi:hypothetical protein